MGTVPLEVLVGQQGFLAFFIEHFIHIGKKLGSQINRQLCSILSCKSVTNTIAARAARSTDSTRGVPTECVPYAFGQSVLERLDNGGVGLVKRFLVLVIEALGQGRRETVSNQLVLGVGSQFTLENVSFPLIEFRRQEGAALQKKFTEKVDNIQALFASIEPYEKSRVEKIKTNIVNGLQQIPNVEYDKNRLEQELIYYIEKLDISEEKQRLSNHLKYFRETMNEEGHGVGKKLGFIAQEMGREINTTGSKSNQAEMQNIVVKMKDELEQIKEQVLNAL